MELVKEIVAHWRRDRQYRETFMESVDGHIGGVKQDSVNWSLMVRCIVFGCTFFWDTLGGLLGGSTGAALVSGLFCSLTLFGFSSKLKLPQMLKTAHEDALKNSKVK